ncbi:MAG: biotin--[acetyl-CoA-carboxylase] ligase [Synergistaceae bacterium]
MNKNVDISNKTKVLNFLISENRYISGTTLSNSLGISRQAIFKIIKQLKDEGLEILSIPQKGYQLKNIDKNIIIPSYIEYLLLENSIFSKCLFFKEIDSTQSEAKKHARKNAKEGLIVIANSQSNGRGRRNRKWENSDDSNLMFSLLLRPQIPTTHIQILNLCVGIVIKKVLRNIYGINATLKWPNDILVNGKKIAGILSEIAGDCDQIYYALCGIGINVNSQEKDFPIELQKTATSMRLITGEFYSKSQVLINLLKVMGKYLVKLNEQDGIIKITEEYKSECDTIGKMVEVIDDSNRYIGEAIEVRDNGELCVLTQDKTLINFSAADVVHLRLAR